MIDALLLRRTFSTTLTYFELKDHFNKRIGTNFKLGFIDNEELSVYYLKDWYTERGLDGVPSCQVQIKNEVDADGRIQIRFSIATYALIMAAFSPFVLMAIFYYTNTPVPFYYTFGGVYFVMYSFSIGMLYQQGDQFKIDLQELEAKKRMRGSANAGP